MTRIFLRFSSRIQSITNDTRNAGYFVNQQWSHLDTCIPCFITMQSRYERYSAFKNTGFPEGERGMRVSKEAEYKSSNCSGERNSRLACRLYYFGAFGRWNDRRPVNFIYVNPKRRKWADDELASQESDVFRVGCLHQRLMQSLHG
jgi:hypothetical protein